MAAMMMPLYALHPRPHSANASPKKHGKHGKASTATLDRRWMHESSKSRLSQEGETKAQAVHLSNKQLDASPTSRLCPCHLKHTQVRSTVPTPSCLHSTLLLLSCNLTTFPALHNTESVLKLGKRTPRSRDKRHEKRDKCPERCSFSLGRTRSSGCTAVTLYFPPP